MMNSDVIIMPRHCYKPQVTSYSYSYTVIHACMMDVSFYMHTMSSFIGDKLFQRGSNISEIFRPGVQISWGSKYAVTGLIDNISFTIFITSKSFYAFIKTYYCVYAYIHFLSMSLCGCLSHYLCLCVNSWQKFDQLQAGEPETFLTLLGLACYSPVNKYLHQCNAPCSENFKSLIFQNFCAF